MTLTGKQKRFLRAKMVTQPAIIQIGKAGLNPNLIIQIEDALIARELIKVKMQSSSGLELEETAQEIAREVGAELIQLIGNNMVFYRRNNREVKISFPASKTEAKSETKAKTERSSALSRTARKVSSRFPSGKTASKKSISKRPQRNENAPQGYAKPEARR